MSDERRSVVVADGVGALARLVRTLRLVWRLLLDPRVPIWTKLVIPATALYVLSPIDLMPDMILGLGQIDDLAILLLGISLFIELCPHEIVAEHRRALAGSPPATGCSEEDVVEGSYRVVPDDDPKGQPR